MITADVSLLDTTTLGMSVTIIVNVTFERESPEAYDAFRKRMSKAAEVAQCYSVSGTIDFVLVCHAHSLEAYEKWAERALMADSNIKRFDSHIAWSRTKFTTALSL